MISSTTSTAVTGAACGAWRCATAALIGYGIHQRGTEGIDHFCDGTMAFAFNGIRELCGALPEEVLLARKPPSDVRPYHRLFEARPMTHAEACGA
ncbi:MAG TPA: hypothetical protein VIH81_15260 [Roseiarcus sp.]|jgi:hypothetical protein